MGARTRESIIPGIMIEPIAWRAGVLLSIRRPNARIVVVAESVVARPVREAFSPERVSAKKIV